LAVHLDSDASHVSGDSYAQYERDPISKRFPVSHLNASAFDATVDGVEAAGPGALVLGGGATGWGWGGTTTADGSAIWPV
jgi:hypothetical protein